VSNTVNFTADNPYEITGCSLVYLSSIINLGIYLRNGSELARRNKILFEESSIMGYNAKYSRQEQQTFRWTKSASASGQESKPSKKSV
jgi:hypothetical protein